MRETRTAQTSLFDVYAQHKFGDFLRALSNLLDTHHEILTLIEVDLVMEPTCSIGRKGLSAERVFRCMLLKQITGDSYDMSFVGPGSALFNQDDLIVLRTEKGVHQLIPGLTQVNGQDELPIPQKVDLDLEYLQRQLFLFDLKMLWMSIIKVIQRSGVSH